MKKQYGNYLQSGEGSLFKSKRQFVKAFSSLLVFVFLVHVPVFAFSVYQPKTLSGTVTEENGEPLIGATVVVKGTTMGTVTDLNGKFTLSVPADATTLVFSFVGMTSQEVIIGDQRIFSIALVPESVGLEEVMIVGYGTQKKESVVGSIARTQRDVLERRGGVTNLSTALAGQIPGVTVLESSGQPGGEDPVILIRGLSTWNGSQPLTLVDGVERGINDIDISEVESVSVLKDASATAVFGVKGANGVILITTRRGHEGKTTFSATANYGIKAPSRTYTVLDSYEQFKWMNQGVENFVSVDESVWPLYTPPEIVDYYKKPQQEPYSYLFPNVNWSDELLKKFATNQRYNLNITGGTGFVKYFGSLAYSHEGDIFDTPYNSQRGYDPGYGYNRLNFRGNFDFTLTKSTNLSVDLHGFTGVEKNTRLYKGGIQYDGIYQKEPSSFPMQYPDGFFGISTKSAQGNPFAELNYSGSASTNRSQLATDIKLKQELDFITQGLSITANLSFDNYVISSGPNIEDGGNHGQILYEYIDPAILYAKTHADSVAAVQYLTSQGMNPKTNEFDFQLSPVEYTPENVSKGQLSRALFYQLALNYSRTFSRHDVSFLALMNRRENAKGATFPSYREDWVSRVTYNFDQKYFVEFNGAYNGSEKFGPEYRFGFFPSAAVGWMVSRENFLSFTWLDEFKIRASVGKVGSDAGIPRWGYLDSWIYQGSTDQQGGATYFGFPLGVRSPYTHYFEGTIANPSIRWETALKKNIGVDIGILSNKIRLGFDYFIDQREDIFLTADKRSVPDFFGADPVPANLGATETKGFELELSLRKRWNSGWSVWTTVNMSRAHDVITKYEDPELLPDYQKTQGFPINQTRSGLREDRLTNWDEVYASNGSDVNNYKFIGDWGIIDFNADGKVDSYDAVPYGFPNNRPQNTYSTSVGFGYKNFSFMVQFYGVTNINQNINIKTPRPDSRGIIELLSDYWTPDNPDAFWQAPRYANTTSVYSGWGDLSWFDGSYIKLKTLQISYDFPERWVQTLGIAHSRIFVNGNDLFYWSKLPFDVGMGSSLGYPIFKQLNLGVNIDF